MTTYLRSIKLLTLTIFIFSFIGAMPATTKNAGGSFVATTQSYRHSQFEQASILNQKEKGATAWLGERVNFQIYIWSSSENAAVKISSSKLSGEGVTTISPSNVKLSLVRFLSMNTKDAYPTDSSSIDLVPDMLDPYKPFTLKKSEIQPIWVGVDIPRDATPGIYKGVISVEIGHEVLSFEYDIDVLNLTIPEVKDWSFDLNLWTHPQATAHYYCGSVYETQYAHNWSDSLPKGFMWSDEHLSLYRPTLELLRDAGLKTVLINLIKDPWLSTYKLKSEQHQTNYPYDELIHWRLTKDGSFKFDFSDFERYVKFCFSIGIDHSIECYSMLTWLVSSYSGISYFDESQGKEVVHKFEDWDEYKSVWTLFIKEFVDLLVKNGWFEKCRIGVDERGINNIPHIIEVLEKFPHNGETLRISAAVNKTHSFDDQIAVISMHGGTDAIVNDKWTTEQYAKWAQERRGKGLKSTWYTCTGTYPGNFGNSRPAESLFIGWYSAAIGADGYLRWAVDSWSDNATKTTDNKLFETGDTFQVYPGDRDAKQPFTRTSIRFELLRQGIVDYEKIRTLRSLYPDSSKDLDELLLSVVRPKMPKRIEGQSSILYEDISINDFSDITDYATSELCRISKKYSKE
ncbi:MAG: glycoside hydrolase domain-containing protein [Bacteroidales bacterium]